MGRWGSLGRKVVVGSETTQIDRVMSGGGGGGGDRDGGVVRVSRLQNSDLGWL